MILKKKEIKALTKSSCVGVFVIMAVGFNG